MTTSNMPQHARLSRRWVVAQLLRERGDLLVVAGLGAAVWDCAAAGDHPLTFPVWGAMGSASMVGLGLALAQPRRPVLVVTGDGEMLMGLGGLATIGVRQPPNLRIAVLDNEHYGETGNQPTHTGRGVDLTAIARACGFRQASVATTEADILALHARLRTLDGPSFTQVKIDNDKPPLAMPPKDGSHLKDRFRVALLGAAAFE